MEKPTIYATGNERLTGDYNISYYIVEKSQKFNLWLQKLVTEVIGCGDNEEINFIQADKKQKTDKHEVYQKESSRLDVFYGKKRAYLTFRKSREIRIKFIEFMEKYSSWVKVKEVKEKSKDLSAEFKAD